MDLANYDIIHISPGFEGDIPEYQPLGDTKALARYVVRYSGIVAREDMRYMLCDIFE